MHRIIGNEEFDNEGQTLTLEFPQCYIVNVYVPKSGEHSIKDCGEMKNLNNFLCYLDYKKKVFLSADLNVAHMEIDLTQPRLNVGMAALTIDERDDLTNLLMSGFVDAFRYLFPRDKRYTFWQFGKGHRKKNIGWRLDYLLVSERWKDKILNVEIHDQVGASDHCPVTLAMSFDSSLEAVKE